MKRSAPASSGSDQDKLKVEVPDRSDLIRFVVINIPRINVMTVEVPSDYTVDGIKESIVREPQHREGVTLKRREFCLTQFDHRVSYEAPASAVSTQTCLSFRWTANEADRPPWARGP